MLGLAPAIAGLAWAGGSSLDQDEEDQSNAGVVFFGVVKDLDRGGGVPDAKVSAEIRNGNTSLVTRSDDGGRFHFSGSKDIDLKAVEIICSKDGLTLQRAVRRPPLVRGDGVSLIEIDCLMVRK